MFASSKVVHALGHDVDNLHESNAELYTKHALLSKKVIILEASLDVALEHIDKLELYCLPKSSHHSEGTEEYTNKRSNK